MTLLTIYSDYDLTNELYATIPIKAQDGRKTKRQKEREEQKKNKEM